MIHTRATISIFLSRAGMVDESSRSPEEAKAVEEFATKINFRRSRIWDVFM